MNINLPSTMTGDYVEGPLPKLPRSARFSNPFKESEDAKRRYFGLRTSPSRDEFCYHLIVDEGREVGGFISIKIATEMDDEVGELRAFMSVEYVYVKALLRYNGHSAAMLHLAHDVTVLWLSDLIDRYRRAYTIKLLHSSNEVSSGGCVFMGRLDNLLRHHCDDIGAAFVPAMHF